MSLKLKIALVFSGLLLLAVGSLSAVLARSATRALARERDEDALKRAAGLAEVCRGTIFSQQDLQAANYLRRLKSSPEILEATTSQGARITFALNQFDVQLRRWRAVYNHGQAEGNAIAALDISISNHLPVRWVDGHSVRPLLHQFVKPGKPKRKNV